MYPGSVVSELQVSVAPSYSARVLPKAAKSFPRLEKRRWFFAVAGRLAMFSQETGGARLRSNLEQVPERRIYEKGTATP